MSHADGAQTLGTHNSRDLGGNGGAAGDKDGKIRVEASSEQRDLTSAQQPRLTG